MPRRIEVELTSSRPDGTWTWRAAGAREPKGVLDGGLLEGGVKVGDVVRAEAEFEIDGITITAVLPSKGKAERPQDRLEILGPERDFEPVTSTLVGRRDRPRRDRDRDGGGGGGNGRGSGRPRRNRDE